MFLIILSLEKNNFFGQEHAIFLNISNRKFCMNTSFTTAQKAFSASIYLLVLTLFLSFNSLYAEDGAKLFKQNCAVCHRTDDRDGTGPGLKGVFDRVPKTPTAEDWLLKWVKDNKKVLASGDAYALKRLADFKGASMTDFGFLSDEDIKSILAYVKNPPVEVAKTEGPKAEGAAATSEGADYTWILVTIAIFLIIIIAVLRGVKKSLQNVLNEKQGKPHDADLTAWEEIKIWMNSHKTKVAVIIILLLGWLSKEAWYAMMDIGVYTGYKPSQPIAFSHKIHAGDNAINCQYCHSGVEKSRHAGIPSVNVCMNCHKGIEKGPTTGTEEIAKIYDAAGWNPEKQVYDKPQMPIKWVKVHNLPDFVYFSHQQHVKVGKQECQTCHGDVAKMTVAEQFAPLTMAWCIECHRKTEVPGMKDNPYYEELHKKLAEKFRGQPDSMITVARMGGIECGKCHY